MPVPGTQEINKPLLEAFKDEAPHSFVINDFLELMADSFGENLSEMSSSDKNIFKNNINESKIYLKNRGLLSHPSKGTYMITRKGLEILDENPVVIDDKYFEGKTKDSLLPELPLPIPMPEKQEQETEISEDINVESASDFAEQEFIDAPEEEVVDDDDDQEEENEQPVIEEEYQEESEENETEMSDENEQIEQIEQEEELETESESESKSESEYDSGENYINEAFAKYNSELAEEVLSKISSIPSDRFEMLVIDLLSKMGYFAFQTARYTVDSPGSELIHGVIIDNNNPGTTPIYIQARKLSPEKTVGRSDMEDFAKALNEKGGRGIFATTANFSEKAAFIANDERIMMIDGIKLAKLMIAHNFCVNVEKVFEVKAVDLDSFSEYES